jgi:hypothetical protein
MRATMARSVVVYFWRFASGELACPDGRELIVCWAFAGADLDLLAHHLDLLAHHKGPLPAISLAAGRTVRSSASNCRLARDWSKPR